MNFVFKFNKCVKNIFILLSNFILICLITLGKSRYVYILTAAKLILSIVFDTFLVSTLNISANLGVNGIGYSNIIVNIILFAVSVVLLSKEGYKIFNKEKLSFTWAKEFIKIGSISGLESFVRNIAYMLMISRMVNMVKAEVKTTQQDKLWNGGKTKEIPLSKDQRQMGGEHYTNDRLNRAANGDDGYTDGRSSEQAEMALEAQREAINSRSLIFA